MKTLSLLSAVGILFMASSADAQVYSTICSESFDYAAGDLDFGLGGTGWVNEWWCNGTNHGTGNPTNMVVALPGHDATGGMATDILNGIGAWRMPDAGAWPNITENLMFGVDDSEMWISFTTRRSPGSDDQYGGVSLHIQLTSEELFLGCPYQTDAWGYADPGGNVATVVGSNVDQLTKLVYRIEFLPGDERLSMWIDPTVDHPTTAPDLQAMINDMRWNEVRMQSGAQLTTHGFEWDGLTFETLAGAPGVAYCFGDGSGTTCPCGNTNDGSNGDAGCANGANAGGASLTGAGAPSVSGDTVVLTATGVQPSQPGLFFRADNAVNGGVGILFGDGLRCAGGSLVRLGIVTSDVSGVATSNPGVGAGLTAGDIKRYQYWYRNPSGTPCGSAFNLSNGYEITWSL